MTICILQIIPIPWSAKQPTRRARPLGHSVQGKWYKHLIYNKTRKQTILFNLIEPRPNAVLIKQFARKVYTLVMMLVWKPGPKPEILPQLNPSILFGRLQGLTPVHSCTNWSLCISGSLDEGDCKR